MLLLFRRLQGGHAKAEIRHVTVRLPFDADGRADALLQMGRELVAVGVPGRAPAARHHLLPADRSLLEAGIILDEIVVARLGRLDPALIDHLGPIELDLGQILDQGLVLVIEGIFPLDQRLALDGHIGTGQGTFHAVLIVKFEGFAQLAVRRGIAPARQRIGIEKQAITARRNDEGNAHLGVVLEEFFVPPLVVEFAGLVLAETVERFFRIGLEARADRPGLLPFHLDGHEGKTSFLQERRTVAPEEIHGGRSLVDFHDQAVGRQPHLAAGLRHLEIAAAGLRNHGQTLTVVEPLAGHGGNPDDIGSDDLQPDRRILTGNENLVAFHGKSPLARYQKKGKQQEEESLFHNQSVSV